MQNEWDGHNTSSVSVLMLFTASRIVLMVKLLLCHE